MLGLMLLTIYHHNPTSETLKLWQTIDEVRCRLVEIGGSDDNFREVLPSVSLGSLRG
jgi:hypothetical protein